MDNADVYDAQLYGIGALKHVEVVTDPGLELVRFKQQLHNMVFNLERANVAEPVSQDVPELMDMHAFSIVDSMDMFRSTNGKSNAWVDALGSYPKVFKPTLGNVTRVQTNMAPDRDVAFLHLRRDAVKSRCQ